MNFLFEKLPKENYSPVKILQLDIKSFFKTIGCIIDE